MYDDERMELVRWVGWGVGPGGETCPFLMASICFDRFLCSLCACSCVLDHRTSYKISLCAPILVLVSPCEATLVMVGGRCGLPASSGCYSILGILLLCFFAMVSHDYWSVEQFFWMYQFSFCIYLFPKQGSSRFLRCISHLTHLPRLKCIQVNVFLLV